MDNDCSSWSWAYHNNAMGKTFGTKSSILCWLRSTGDRRHCYFSILTRTCMNYNDYIKSTGSREKTEHCFSTRKKKNKLGIAVCSKTRHNVAPAVRARCQSFSTYQYRNKRIEAKNDFRLWQDAVREKQHTERPCLRPHLTDGASCPWSFPRSLAWLARTIGGKVTTPDKSILSLSPTLSAVN